MTDTKKAKLLYVEDDINLSFVTRENLEKRGYTVDLSVNGKQALEKFNTNYYDLCILDVMLPKMDGFSLASKIRETNHNIPIIFLTAKSTLEDKINGLRIGGDDYIIKPFSIEELVLKIEIFLKRRTANPTDVEDTNRCTLGGLNIDFFKQIIASSEGQTKMTFRESELLKFFCQKQNEIIKREDILLKIWGKDDYFSGRSMDVFVSRLRKYLKSDPTLEIENIHRVGFRLKVDS